MPVPSQHGSETTLLLRLTAGLYAMLTALAIAEACTDLTTGLQLVDVLPILT